MHVPESRAKVHSIYMQAGSIAAVTRSPAVNRTMLVSRSTPTESHMIRSRFQYFRLRVSCSVPTAAPSAQSIYCISTSSPTICLWRLATPPLPVEHCCRPSKVDVSLVPAMPLLLQDHCSLRLPTYLQRHFHLQRRLHLKCHTANSAAPHNSSQSPAVRSAMPCITT